jgi:hypothetical protein
MRDSEVGKPLRRGEDGVEVEERLAHAHVHRVVDGLPAPEVQCLVEDLGLRQVAPEAHRAGGATTPTHVVFIELKEPRVHEGRARLGPG